MPVSLWFRYRIKQTVQFGLEVVFANLTRPFSIFRLILAAGILQRLQVQFDIIHFSLDDLLLNFRRLRESYQTGRGSGDDTIPVIVLDLMKKRLPFVRPEIVLAGCQYPAFWISRSVGFRDLPDISFQSQDHRFMYNAQAFHFHGGDDHGQCFAKTHFVIDQGTPVLYNAPARR